MGYLQPDDELICQWESSIIAVVAVLIPPLHLHQVYKLCNI